jgi:Lysyl oxidase
VSHRGLSYSAGIVAVVVAIGAAVYTGVALSSQSFNLASQIQTQVANAQPGALVDVNMTSQVGVLLDEIPVSDRSHAADHFASASDSFWTERAKDQISLMSYRLVFRDSYYDANESKGALPLPPEEVWHIQFTGSPYRTNVSGHDLVIRNYTFTSTLLTSEDSPAISEPALASIGGQWAEPFILPVDPELLFQRTGFACLDENQFPPKSVDPEEVATFYDQEATIGGTLSIQDQHESVMPDMSCVDTLDAKVGKVETNLNFERDAWSPSVADTVRVGKITNPTGPDLITIDSEFHHNRIVYRYVAPSDCALVENTVTGTGWRKLLQFSAADTNYGAKNLDIGSVDYFLNGNKTDLAKRGIFEFSPCHNHYHFKHYGSFSLGDVLNHKQGFCLQSTNRFTNNEYSPLTNDYSGCSYQGIESGWADEYIAGLEGQWIDVTKISTSKGPAIEPLTFHTNPDGFLCEGTPVKDSNGSNVYEPTDFRTAGGQVVYKQECNYAPGALENNVDSYNVTVPVNGQGYVTGECSRDEIGPMRNCGFQLADTSSVLNCTPSEDVRLSLKLQQGSDSQVLRICPYSDVLGSPIACTYNGPYNAKSVANFVVNSTEGIVNVVCPGPLDYTEPGGKISLYSAPLLPFDSAAPIEVRQLS